MRSGQAIFKHQKSAPGIPNKNWNVAFICLREFSPPLFARWALPFPWGEIWRMEALAFQTDPKRQVPVGWWIFTVQLKVKSPWQPSTLLHTACQKSDERHGPEAGCGEDGEGSYAYCPPLPHPASGKPLVVLLLEWTALEPHNVQGSRHRCPSTVVTLGF